jgi:hypothetical protein
MDAVGRRERIVELLEELLVQARTQEVDDPVLRVKQLGLLRRVERELTEGQPDPFDAALDALDDIQLEPLPPFGSRPTAIPESEGLDEARLDRLEARVTRLEQHLKLRDDD